MICRLFRGMEKIDMDRHPTNVVLRLHSKQRTQKRTQNVLMRHKYRGINAESDKDLSFDRAMGFRDRYSIHRRKFSDGHAPSQSVKTKDGRCRHMNNFESWKGE